jgi:DNA helicase-2/ATP-dependent DNA helicase PcrA
MPSRDKTMLLRPSQKEIIQYTRGKLGIAAVPGSGKTWTLSLLAADLIRRGILEDDQEVLVVTLVNSAVGSFYSQISKFLPRLDLLYDSGYRVRTLHGLAHDIVRERPSLVGLEEKFVIVDEREANNLRDEVAQAWLRRHPYDLDEYLDPDLEEGRREGVRRDQLPTLVQEIALEFIRSAKDLQLTPETLRRKLDALPVPLPLAEMGAELYADYQRGLNYRGGVDFDDLIVLALRALEADPLYLERLRYRWPYILEDEAQDSSRLQERILSLLAGPTGNWARVGDPNQAIYETFTTANPRYLRAFIQRPEVTSRELPNSGRSMRTIIDLANRLVAWVQLEHPFPEVRDALSAPPWIEPAPPGDPQSNPPDDPAQVRIIPLKYSPDDEIRAVVDSLARWLPEHPEETVAVLAPRNERGEKLVDELRRRGLPFVDSLLRSTASTRASAGVLDDLLRYLSDPQSASRLARVYQRWQRLGEAGSVPRKRQERAAELIRKIRQVEDYLWPEPEHDWLAGLGLEQEDPELYAQLAEFRQLVRRWQGSILLPIDQVVLTLAQDLLGEPTELAIAHKLAVLLRRASQTNPGWHLPELSDELGVIARNERRFLGFDDADTGFDPDNYEGKVIVATVHKAKGLEWDRVYLMSVNNYDYPSGMSYDQYIAEKWFIKDKLNLGAEALAQLEAVMTSNAYDWYEEGSATRQARLDYVRERLRLLYVGITRARRELVITWNTGRRGELQPALPLAALRTFLDERSGNITR